LHPAGGLFVNGDEPTNRPRHTVISRELKNLEFVEPKPAIHILTLDMSVNVICNVVPKTADCATSDIAADGVA
jgi:hypothetical protein